MTPQEQAEEVFKSKLQAQVEHQTETYKSLITISTAAFKSLQLLNGGAVIGMLTYLGHIENASFTAISAFKWGLGAFMFGLFLATAVYIPAYLTQLNLHQENVSDKRMTHHRWLNLALFLCTLSLLSFLVGGWCTLEAIAKIAIGNS
ncbi:MAG: hypothetical protein VW548_04025 [Methylotenera sp.]